MYAGLRSMGGTTLVCNRQDDQFSYYVVKFLKTACAFSPIALRPLGRNIRNLKISIK